jgi:hypothetical protein
MDSSANAAASGRPAGNAAPNNNNPNRDTEIPKNSSSQGRRCGRRVEKRPQSASRGPQTASGCQGGNNGNYDSNPDADPGASAQHREYDRSSPSSQLPSLTSANPNGPASQNSVLQTPQNLVEFNNECLLVYNKYLIPNSEFARVHQRINQELWQQEQLAREEAAKLKESVVTALAKAIAASYVPRRQPQEQMAKYNEAIEATMVPETPNSAPEANQNLALEPNTLALQARTLLGNQNSFPQTSKTWALVTAAQQQPQQPQQPGEGSPLVPQHQPGGLAAAQHQPGEGNLTFWSQILAPSMQNCLST